jgi:hypothetical protein
MRGAPLCSRPIRPGRLRRLRKNSDASGFGRGTTGARLHLALKNSVVRSFLGGTEIQCLLENSFSSNPVERNVLQFSPAGASEA